MLLLSAKIVAKMNILCVLNYIETKEKKVLTF